LSSALARLVHVLVAVAFITGLIGRAVAFRQARGAGTLQATAALLTLSEWFERRLVIPGSILVLISGVAIAWTGRWPLLTTTRRPTWLLVSLLLLLLPIGFIPAVLVPRRARRQAALTAALEAGRRTPDLDAALQSTVVLQLRMLELAIVAAVFVLMVLKPF
jgi:uncharacterized membrane protein